MYSTEEPKYGTDMLYGSVVTPTEPEVIELHIILFLRNKQTTGVMNNEHIFLYWAWFLGKRGYGYRTFHDHQVIIDLRSVEFSAL